MDGVKKSRKVPETSLGWQCWNMALSDVEHIVKSSFTVSDRNALSVSFSLQEVLLPTSSASSIKKRNLFAKKKKFMTAKAKKENMYNVKALGFRTDAVTENERMAIDDECNCENGSNRDSLVVSGNIISAQGVSVVKENLSNCSNIVEASSDKVPVHAGDSVVKSGSDHNVALADDVILKNGSNRNSSIMPAQTAELADVGLVANYHDNVKVSASIAIPVEAVSIAVDNESENDCNLVIDCSVDTSSQALHDESQVNASLRLTSESACELSNCIGTNVVQGLSSDEQVKSQNLPLVVAKSSLNFSADEVSQVLLNNLQENVNISSVSQGIHLAEDLQIETETEGNISGNVPLESKSNASSESESSLSSKSESNSSSSESENSKPRKPNGNKLNKPESGSECRIASSTSKKNPREPHKKMLSNIPSNLSSIESKESVSMKPKKNANNELLIDVPSKNSSGKVLSKLQKTASGELPQHIQSNLPASILNNELQENVQKSSACTSELQNIDVSKKPKRHLSTESQANVSNVHKVNMPNEAQLSKELYRRASNETKDNELSDVQEATKLKFPNDQRKKLLNDSVTLLQPISQEAVFKELENCNENDRLNASTAKDTKSSTVVQALEEKSVKDQKKPGDKENLARSDEEENSGFKKHRLSWLSYKQREKKRERDERDKLQDHAGSDSSPHYDETILSKRPKLQASPEKKDLSSLKTAEPYWKSRTPKNSDVKATNRVPPLISDSFVQNEFLRKAILHQGLTNPSTDLEHGSSIKKSSSQNARQNKEQQQSPKSPEKGHKPLKESQGKSQAQGEKNPFPKAIVSSPKHPSKESGSSSKYPCTESCEESRKINSSNEERSARKASISSSTEKPLKPLVKSLMNSPNEKHNSPNATISSPTDSSKKLTGKTLINLPSEKHTLPKANISSPTDLSGKSPGNSPIALPRKPQGKSHLNLPYEKHTSPKTTIFSPVDSPMKAREKGPLNLPNEKHVSLKAAKSSPVVNFPKSQGKGQQTNLLNEKLAVSKVSTISSSVDLSLKALAKSGMLHEENSTIPKTTVPSLLDLPFPADLTTVASPTLPRLISAHLEPCTNRSPSKLNRLTAGIRNWSERLSTSTQNVGLPSLSDIHPQHSFVPKVASAYAVSLQNEAAYSSHNLRTYMELRNGASENSDIEQFPHDVDYRKLPFYNQHFYGAGSMSNSGCSQHEQRLTNNNMAGMEQDMELDTELNMESDIEVRSSDEHLKNKSNISATNAGSGKLRDFEKRLDILRPTIESHLRDKRFDEIPIDLEKKSATSAVQENHWALRTMPSSTAPRPPVSSLPNENTASSQLSRTVSNNLLVEARRCSLSEENTVRGDSCANVSVQHSMFVSGEKLHHNKNQTCESIQTMQTNYTPLFVSNANAIIPSDLNYITNSIASNMSDEHFSKIRCALRALENTAANNCMQDEMCKPNVSDQEGGYTSTDIQSSDVHNSPASCVLTREVRQPTGPSLHHSVINHQQHNLWNENDYINEQETTLPAEKDQRWQFTLLPLQLPELSPAALHRRIFSTSKKKVEPKKYPVIAWANVDPKTGHEIRDPSESTIINAFEDPRPYQKEGIFVNKSCFSHNIIAKQVIINNNELMTSNSSNVAEASAPYSEESLLQAIDCATSIAAEYEEGEIIEESEISTLDSSQAREVASVHVSSPISAASACTSSSSVVSVLSAMKGGRIINVQPERVASLPSCPDLTACPVKSMPMKNSTSEFVSRLVNDLAHYPSDRFHQVAVDVMKKLRATSNSIRQEYVYENNTMGMSLEQRQDMLASSVITISLRRELEAEKTLEDIDRMFLQLKHSKELNDPTCDSDKKRQLEIKFSNLWIRRELAFKALEVGGHYGKCALSIEVLPDAFRLNEEKNSYCSVEGHLLFVKKEKELEWDDCRFLLAVVSELNERHRVIKEKNQTVEQMSEEERISLGYLHNLRKNYLNDVCVTTELDCLNFLEKMQKKLNIYK